jgi:hypothetical protein
MSDVDVYRRKADELLRQATLTTDLSERSRLISEAVGWHMKAMEAEDAGRTGEPRDGEDLIPPADTSEPEAS